MKFFSTSSVIQLSIVLLTVLLIQGCGEDNRFTGPNFDTVPEPYNIAEADSSFTTEGGVEIHVMEKGYGSFTVISRDQITLRYTGRSMEDGEIFLSSYANSSTQPLVIRNLRTVSSGGQSPQIEGLRQGLLGMKEGEKRVIIVPPSLGYSESRPTANGVNLVGDSLRYDVELVSIL